jgi:hypothetical protein
MPSIPLFYHSSIPPEGSVKKPNSPRRQEASLTQELCDRTFDRPRQNKANFPRGWHGARGTWFVGGNSAKQSQTWEGWGIWAKAPNDAKQSQFRAVPGGPGFGGREVWGQLCETKPIPAEPAGADHAKQTQFRPRRAGRGPGTRGVRIYEQLIWPWCPNSAMGLLRRRLPTSHSAGRPRPGLGDGGGTFSVFGGPAVEYTPWRHRNGGQSPPYQGLV